jgi:spore germination cell wall hydrolase CwlJ-like protein
MAQSRQADEAAALVQVSAPATAAPVASTTVAATINQAGVQSGQLLHASLVGPAAKPFQYAAARTATDLDCLTEAVYYEARGEGPAGEAAVAQVVLNRVRHPAFPNTICGVVFQGCQFSFACNGAMSRHREPAAWREARRIAKRALAGAVVANIGNATHFHTLGVNPAWGPRLMRVAQVGYHVFYRMGGRAGRPGAFTAQAQPSTTADAAPALENAPVLASIAPTPASALTQAVFTSSAAAPKVQLVDPATTALAKPAPVPAAPKPAAPTAAATATTAAATPAVAKVEVSTTAARPEAAPAATAS